MRKLILKKALPFMFKFLEGKRFQFFKQIHLDIIDTCNCAKIESEQSVCNVIFDFDLMHPVICYCNKHIEKHNELLLYTYYDYELVYSFIN